MCPFRKRVRPPVARSSSCGARDGVEVLDDVRIAVGAADREIGAGPVVVEAEAGVLVEDPAAARVEERLRQFPEFGAQDLEPVPREVEHLAVEHRRLGVLLGETRLELLVGLRHLALRRGLPALRLRDQFCAASLVLLLRLALALLQPGLPQDVVDDAGDRDAQRTARRSGSRWRSGNRSRAAPGSRRRSCDAVLCSRM